MNIFANTTGNAADIIAADSGVIRDVAKSVESVRVAIENNDTEFTDAKNILTEAFKGPGADSLEHCLHLIQDRNAVVSDGLQNLKFALENYADNVDDKITAIKNTVTGGA